MAEIVLAGNGKLYKRIFTSEYVPGRPGTPAQPATPATPGRWEVQTSQVCVLNFNDPNRALDLLSVKVGSKVPVAGSYRVDMQICTTTTKTVWIPPSGGTPPKPAIPAVPEQIKYDYQLGWNARAYSIPAMQYDGSFSFKVPKNALGAMVGLTVLRPTNGYADMTNAFYVRKGSVKIHEFGAEVQSVGSDPDASLRIRRAAGKVQYFVNDEMVREVDATVFAPIWLSAGLYSGGDEVIEPVYTRENTGRIGGNIHAFKGYVTDTDFCTLDGTLQAFTSSLQINIQNQLGGELQPFYGYLGRDACIIGGELQPLQGMISAPDLVPTFGIIGGFILPPIGTLHMNTGQVATLNVSLQPLVGALADRPVGYLFGKMEPFVGNVYGLPPGQAYLLSDAYSGGDMIAASELSVIMSSKGTVSGLMLTEVWYSALMNSSGTISQTMALEAQIEVLLQSLASTVAGLLPPDKTGEAWVFHEDAGGMTRYTGYDFNSFAKLGGRYYGAKPDGIYLLEGPDDDGDDIRFLVNFGSMSFGTLERKALPYVYVGMASSGETFLRLTADGQTYTYKVSNDTENMKAHRYEPGRGLRASFYEVELVSDGELFDLQSIEFHPIELKRRL